MGYYSTFRIAEREYELVKFAYADPPYIGQAKRHYDCPEIDHVELIGRLQRDFPDGWVLSASSSSLQKILPMCPANIRIGAWVKSFCAFKRNVRPAYAWEPVIFCGGRNPVNGYRAAIPEKNGKQLTPKDFHVAPITLKKGLVGAKPESVCHWILDLLNVQEGDEVEDLYPGTGVMGRVAATRTLATPDTVPTACRCDHLKKVLLDLRGKHGDGSECWCLRIYKEKGQHTPQCEAAQILIGELG